MVELPFEMAAGWIAKLVTELRTISESRKAQIEKLRAIVDDPVVLAREYIVPNCQSLQTSDDDNDIMPKEALFDVIARWLKKPMSSAELDEGRNRLFVLGDAGMGKTSLLVMYKMAQLFSFFPKGFNCEILKIGADTIDKIRAIANPSQTVLLLDALDEDALAWSDATARVGALLTATKGFRRTILTCRSQFFPVGINNIEHPGRIKIAGYTCPLTYLSLFTDDQVDAYLCRRFDGGERERIAAARNKIYLMGELRCRPLLLSHIEDFVADTAKITDEESAYGVLVGAWLERECRKQTGAIDLREFWRACEHIACAIHQGGTRTISATGLAAIEATTPYVKQIANFEISGKSLLNKTSDGEFRFSHYSIQEYLISRAICDNYYVSQRGFARMSITNNVAKFIRERTKSEPKDLRLERLDFAPTTWSKTHFVRCRFAESTLKGHLFDEVTFQNCDLSGADLSSSTFSRSSLSGGSAEATKFDDAAFDQTSVVNTILNRANFRRAQGNLCRLSPAASANANFSASRWSATKLSANFQHSVWERALLERCELSGADFDKARATEVALRDCSAQRLTARGAVLSGAEFERCAFLSFTFESAGLVGSSLAQLRAVDGTSSTLLVDFVGDTDEQLKRSLTPPTEGAVLIGATPGSVAALRRFIDSNSARVVILFDHQDRVRRLHVFSPVDAKALGSVVAGPATTQRFFRLDTGTTCGFLNLCRDDGEKWNPVCVESTEPRRI